MTQKFLAMSLTFLFRLPAVRRLVEMEIVFDYWLVMNWPRLLLAWCPLFEKLKSRVFPLCFRVPLLDQKCLIRS
jgi:hypothetical protein